MTAIAKRRETEVARPLKVLVPLIKQELDAGEQAGIEHYRRAGELLIEAREQIPYGNFIAWLSKNFKLHQRTAYYYMSLAERLRQEPELLNRGAKVSVRELTGRKPDRHTWRRTFKAAKELDAELFAQERQTHDDEVQLHRVTDTPVSA